MYTIKDRNRHTVKHSVAKRPATSAESLQPCEVFHKGAMRKGRIIEEKMDKVKVAFNDPSFLSTWFERKEVHRKWN